MKRLLPTLFAGVFVTLSAFPLFGATISLYHTDFTGPNGTQPTGWTIFEGSSSLISLNANRYYARNGGAAAAQIGSVYLGDDADEWSDYTVNAVWRANSAFQNSGVVLRYSGADNYYNGRLYQGGAGLIIQKVVNGVATPLGAMTLTTPYTSGDYLLHFAAQGDELTFSVGLTEASMESLTVSDSSLSKGGAGVRTLLGPSGISIFSSFSVTTTAIPEPRAAALVVMGIAFFAFRNRYPLLRK